MGQKSIAVFPRLPGFIDAWTTMIVSGLARATWRLGSALEIVDVMTQQRLKFG